MACFASRILKRQQLAGDCMLSRIGHIPPSGRLWQGRKLVLEGIRGMAVDGSDHASAEEVETKLKQKLDAVHLDVADTSGGCGASFNVTVVSPQFEGKSLLARHRLINNVLAKEMETIHALSIRKCQSPKEYYAENPHLEKS